MSTDSDNFLYTNAHYCDMLMCVWQCKDEIPAGRLLYQEKFPNRPLPPEKVFETISHRLMTTGSLNPPLSEPTRLRSGRIRTQVEDDNENEPKTILPTANRKHTRKPQKRADHKFPKPHFLTGSRQLLPSEYGPRLKFCQWYLDQVRENPKFAQNILWSDEATFTRDSLVNEEYWSYVKSKAGQQPSWEIDVWAGIIGTRLIGPVFLPKDRKINYLDIILAAVEDSLEELPLPDYKDIVFQHSSIPEMFASSWKKCLDDRFPVWIGEGGPVAWPFCSMDLNPVHYFLWGHLKYSISMFKKTCKSEEQMRRKITSAFETIRSTPNLLASAIKSIQRNTSLCKERKGGDFSYFL